MTAIQELWAWIDANCHEETFNINDAREMSLRLEQEQSIAFHKWMLQNDTEQNAEKYFHYTDENMWHEFLNSK